MTISETTQKIYNGISNILKENGQALSKSQAYAVECMMKTVQGAVEKECYKVTNQIINKQNKLVECKLKAYEETTKNNVSEETIDMVNEMVENRINELKKEIPEVLDYARMKKLESCLSTIKECVGYNTDEQVEKAVSESAKMLNSTRGLIDTQAKTISEKAASLNESEKKIRQLNEQVKQMKVKLEENDKRFAESATKQKELVALNQNLLRKVEEGKKVNESIEQKRKEESLKYYLESKISQYPKYEASLLRNHFKNAKSRAEIDENFQKALTIVGEKRDAMRSVKPIQVVKATEVAESTNKKISGGESIVRENGGDLDGLEANLYEESFVDIDNDVISNEQMSIWMSKL